MEEINGIIGKHLRNESTSKEEIQLEKWLNGSDHNKRLYQELKSIWTNSDTLRGDKVIDVDKNWLSFLEKVKSQNQKSPKTTNIIRYKRLAVAASVVLAAFFMSLYLSHTSTNLKLNSSSEILSNMKLPDGSVVWLNKNSSIEYQQSEVSRNVKLIGQAYFEVMPNSEKPFIVSSENLKTQVIGTSFEINSNNEGEIDVSVVSGKVKVYDQDNVNDALLLTKGLGTSYNPISKKLAFKQTLNANFLAWKTGILKFRNSSIQIVIKDLSNYYDVEIISNEIDLSSRLTAEFDNLQLEEVIDLIELTTDVKLFITAPNQSN